MNSELVNSFVEVNFKNETDFLKIKETLTRMGIASRKEKKLYQSCHILHKQNKYYIVHFKELFALDGKQTDFTSEDLARRNKITQLLQDWGLLSVINVDKIKEPQANMSNISVIPFKDKQNWKLLPKYDIGKVRKFN